MKYMITGGEPRGEWDRLEAAEQNRRVQHHQQQRLDELIMTRARSGPPGLIFASVGLGAERDVVTVRCGRGEHGCVDGPFAETKEVIGGFDIIEFASRQDAIKWKTADPWHPSHVSEIRPLRAFWWISGIVDRVRLMSFERWSETTPATPPDRTAAMQLFMLTSIEDEAAVGRLPGSERKQRALEHQLVGAEYVRVRSTVDHDPGMWVGARLLPSTEATTIRWTAKEHVASDGPAASSKEVIAGFNLLACSSFDEAIGWARRLATRDGDVIEVRPVRGCWWFYHE